MAAKSELKADFDRSPLPAVPVPNSDKNSAQMTRKAVKNAPPMAFCQSDKLSNLSQQHCFPSSPKYNGRKPAEKVPTHD
jgi:hypothetical protein